MPSISEVISRGISGLRWSVIGKADYGRSLWVWRCSVSVAVKGDSMARAKQLLHWNVTGNKALIYSEVQR